METIQEQIKTEIQNMLKAYDIDYKDGVYIKREWLEERLEILEEKILEIMKGKDEQKANVLIEKMTEAFGRIRNLRKDPTDINRIDSDLNYWHKEGVKYLIFKKHK